MKILQILAICLLLSNTTAISLHGDGDPPAKVATETDITVNRSKEEAAAAAMKRFRAIMAAGAAKRVVPGSAGEDVAAKGNSKAAAIAAAQAKANEQLK